MNIHPSPYSETGMTTQTPSRTEPDIPTDAPRKRLFTRKEYHAMGKAGILGHQERVELLEGEIIVMSPIGNRHAACVLWLAEAFYDKERLMGRAHIHTQNLVAASRISELQPDLTLLAYREDRYAFGRPRPQDVLLLVEVADSSLDYDRNIKLGHYAELRIPEVWIANLQDDRIESYADPSSEGYGASKFYELGDTISPAAFPDLKISVDDIIPPRPSLK